MDIDKIIESVETHLREFVLYLLSFFKSQSDTDLGFDPESEVFHKIVLFGILSAFFGTYISYWYIDSTRLLGQKLYDVVLEKGLFWLSLGLLLHFVFFILGARPKLMNSVIVILKVMPVAYVVAAYSAYLAENIIGFFAPTEKSIGASVTANVVDFVILSMFLPREIFTMTIPNTIQKRIAYTTILALVFLVVMANFAVYGCNQSTACPASEARNSAKLSPIGPGL